VAVVSETKKASNSRSPKTTRSSTAIATVAPTSKETLTSSVKTKDKTGRVKVKTHKNVEKLKPKVRGRMGRPPAKQSKSKKASSPIKTSPVKSVSGSEIDNPIESVYSDSRLLQLFTSELNGIRVCSHCGKDYPNRVPSYVDIRKHLMKKHSSVLSDIKNQSLYRQARWIFCGISVLVEDLDLLLLN
jgi:hypothetical protein